MSTLKPPPGPAAPASADWLVYPSTNGPAAGPPPFEYDPDWDDPRHYLSDRPLSIAVNVAITLGQPLLVTGEPGTGKTQLAHSVAYELGAGPALVFHTKTTTSAAELFYRYDALRHFHDAQTLKGEVHIRDYIEFQALGLAILLAMPPDEARPYVPAGITHERQRRSVVLIDEIDKAPRDVPNDILDEIESMSFEVKETDWPRFRAESRFRPIVVITSNSERSLPDAFLRRCVFFHLAFPDKDRLQEILRRRLLGKRTETEELRRVHESALAHFEKLRKLPLRKLPATAELLAWTRILEKLGLDPVADAAARADDLAMSYTVLAKNNEDLVVMREQLGKR